MSSAPFQTHTYTPRKILGGEIGVLHDIISKCVKRSGEDLLRLFRRYDDRERGVVKTSELSRVMDKIGCNLKPSELDELNKRYAYKEGEVWDSILCFSHQHE
jgi:hypothetical protein